MSEITKGGSNFIGYEYKEVTTGSERASMYLDGYLNFGWLPDENIQPLNVMGKVILKLKRDRKILNKTELTRLQRHFEACINEIDVMEKSINLKATIWALMTGILGTIFIAGSIFAVTNDPPLILLCVLLSIPGFTGWSLPYFIYKTIKRKRTAKITPFIEQKYDEIFEICEKGNKLLSG